jgi:carboxypeptidase family protein
MIVLTAAGAPSAALAAAEPAGELTGIARGGHLQPLIDASIQLRSVQTGDVVATTTTNEAGSFSFAALPPGTYIAEIVDAAGKTLGVSAPVTLAAGAPATTSVVAAGVGTTSAAAGGFQLLGMGPATSITVLGAAAAASVTAVVANRPDASPSR